MHNPVKQRLLTLLVVSSLALWAGGLMSSVVTAADADQPGLAFSGRYQLQLDGAAVTGNILQYTSTTAIVPGLRWTQHLAVAAFGPLSNNWQLQSNFDSTLEPTERFRLSLRKGSNELLAGTHIYDTNGPGLLQWSRQLTGIQGRISGTGGKLSASGAWGELLGEPAHEELPGRGVTGPYLLNYLRLPLVAGSETVTIDELPVMRGSDYQIDYDTGVLIFREPVLEMSVIAVDYEYVTDTRRRTSIITGKWITGDFAFTALTGREWLVEENPLEFVPPEGSSVDELPQLQEMQGVGAAWQPLPGMQLTGSWLTTTNSTYGASVQVPGWQVGGDWVGNTGSAGFDLRVIPAKWQMFGQNVSDNGYRRLSAGYELQLSGPWYSRLNAIWRLDNAADATASADMHAKVEHVLTYVDDNTLFGFSLGMDDQNTTGVAHKQYLAGAIYNKKIGLWELGLERKGVIARVGEPLPGAFAATTNFSVNTTEKAALNTSFTWRQEDRVPGEGRPYRVNDWRLTAGAASARRSWQVLWREIHTLRTGLADANTTFIRAQANLPLPPNLTSSLSWEGQDRRGTISTRYYKMNASVEYQPVHRINWDVFASAGREVVGGRQEAGFGGTVRIPFSKYLQYSTGLSKYIDATTVQTESNQVVHSLRWSKSGWQIDGAWTQGLLERPAQNTNSSGIDYPPLAELPFGRRLALTLQRQLGTTSLVAGSEYNWESAATGWRTKLQGEHRVENFSINGELSHLVRNAATGVEVRDNALATISWNASDSSELNLTLRHDARRTLGAGEVAGTGNYMGTAIFGEWTLYF